ncbi:T9SS type A sorting domain-containing protein [Flavobacterium sp. ZT3R18]|uniref:zinc-dependent metalloprotease n=1 Tax=Flavobacterium sp. ZT3R18 TaxID=2594429 RepID=UPI00117BCFF3|nr:zinc-dependent metalloprotease family protein [Flavobacterium sp. ZT3R18]TRX34111.1 T9SS type A sorting domain-containing protein [Flavobacterium sp. ZT3R18]
MNRLLLCLGLFVVSFIGYSQGKSPWTAVSYTQKHENNSELDRKLIFKLNETEFRQKLTALHSKSSGAKGISVAIPNSFGKMEQFVVVESSNFAPELQAQYPEIRAYSGTGITDPTASICFSVSPKGIQTMVLRGDSGSEFIEPFADDKSMYAVLTSKNRSKTALPLSCRTVDVALNKELVKKTSQIKSNNGVFKTMRLALSCTSEYTTYFGGTVATALEGMNNTMTRVNGVFNKDLALKLEIIANNNLIVYTNAATDPYSDATAGANGAWNLELQSTLTSVIGNANYDIGHLFGASGGGGGAGCIGCVCVNPSPSDEYGKGSGFTSPSNNEPTGDTFDIDYVAHEMGHQLGANHTFSHAVEGTGVSVEPGSGSTIMGYAGISDGYDVQNQSDDYFSYASILQIQNNLTSKTCPVSTTLSNQTPTVNAGSDYTIPKSTAFVLNGLASDPNGNALTYCWEQNDSAGNSQINENSLAYAAKPNGPNFRSFLPSNSTNRYFPALSRVVAGQLTSSWESVSSIGRDLNFVFTARDNAAIGSGQTNSDAMKVTVDDTKGPFVVTSQNTVDVSWDQGSSQAVTWSVNGTSSLSGSANVNIKLSTDGGLTFPILLAGNTSNDGSEVIIAPTTTAKNCRILIEPTGNIYYAVNSVPFAINYAVTTSCNTYTFAAPYPIPDFQAAYTEKTIVVPATSSEITDVNFNVGFTHTYIGDVQIEVVSPSGTIVKLVDKSCGATNSSLVLAYDDLGEALTCGTTTSQTVVPVGIMSTFNGENPQGTWKLRFRDAGQGNTGTINTASIQICTSSYTRLATSSFEIKDFVLYPNPNKGNFTVRFTSANTTGVAVVVNDMLGRKIYENKFENKGDFNENIQLKNVTAGIYLVSIIDGNRKGVCKIIIE